MAEPHPTCGLCKDDRACVFHAATTPEALAKAFLSTVGRRAGLGLSDFLLSGFAGLVDLPAQLPMTASLPTKALESRLVALLEKPEFSTDDLRAIAATCLALATIYDAREDPDGP